MLKGCLNDSLADAHRPFVWYSSPAPTDKECQASEAELKTTSFVWLLNQRTTGVAKDGKVGTMRAPGYVWPKGSPLMHGEHVDGLIGLWLHGGEYTLTYDGQWIRVFWRMRYRE